MNHNQTHFNVSQHRRIGFIKRIARAYTRYREEKSILHRRSKNVVGIDRAEIASERDPLGRR
jgi:hypothetical protein